MGSSARHTTADSNFVPRRVFDASPPEWKSRSSSSLRRSSSEGMKNVLQVEAGLDERESHLSQAHPPTNTPLSLCLSGSLADQL